MCQMRRNEYRMVCFDFECFNNFIFDEIPGDMSAPGKMNSENIGEPKQLPADRDEVKRAREERRRAKLAEKHKLQDKSRNLPNVCDDEKSAEVKTEVASSTVKKQSPSPKVDSNASGKNSHRKMQKHGKADNSKENQSISPATITNHLDKLKINSEPNPQPSSGAADKPEKKQLTKTERRAIQEAQRAAKAGKTADKTAPQTSKKEITESKEATRTKSKQLNTPSTSSASSARKVVVKKPQQHRVKLFNHLYTDVSPAAILNSSTIHPAIVRLGAQYSGGIVKGCNARGLAFMSTIKSVIAEYETPSQKEFSRGLENVIKLCGTYLQQCRPLAVSVTNAMKFIQFQLRQLNKSESDAEVKLILYVEMQSCNPNYTIIGFYFNSKRRSY